MDMLPLSRRNAETADAAIRRLTEQVHAGLSTILKQEGTLSMLLARVDKLELALKVRELKLTGLGPTVK